MKRKFSNYANNSNLLNTDFMYEEVSTESFKGTISYLKVEKAKEKFIVKRKDGKTECICDSGYSYISIYEYNKNYAITAMYDKKQQLIQLYFDIIKETGIQHDVPYIDDLYLDIVLTRDNYIEVLDEEELKEALLNNVISDEDYILAQKCKEYILIQLKNIQFIQGIKNLAKLNLEKFTNKRE